MTRDGCRQVRIRRIGVGMVMVMTVTCLGKTPLILSHTWLQKHNPDVDWSSGKITLNKCPQECQSLLETHFAKLL